MSNPRAKTKSESLSDIARAAIADSGLSLYELADRSGVNRGILSRFQAGKRTITVETFDRINAVLRLRITRR